MIAYERAIESSRPDALFNDPLASALAGSKGESLSAGFGGACAMFEFPGWSEFHKTWTAVRTKFIDDVVTNLASTGKFEQLVNCGAGMDTRAYRLECYKAFSKGSFEVDMEVINTNKEKVFKEILSAPRPHCNVINVSLDFLSETKTLATELQDPFDKAMPSVFISEGLVMYLGATGKFKLLRDVSAVAAPGSVFILQYLDASDSAKAREDPTLLDSALSAAEAKETLSGLGWGEFNVSRYGEEDLNFGRYPLDKFPP